MGMGFVPTWLRQVSPLLHKTTLTTGFRQVVICCIDCYSAMLHGSAVSPVSVRPSVCRVGVLYPHGWRYRETFCSAW